MRYELKHDKLAMQIYGLVSVEAKARRKAENVYHLYEEIGDTRHFTEEELAYLAQFLSVLRPSETLQRHIAQSKEELNKARQAEEDRERVRLEREKELVARVKARQKSMSWIISIAGLVAVGLLVFAYRESVRAATNQRITNEIRLNLERKDKLSAGLKKELAAIILAKGEQDHDAALAYTTELNNKFPSVFVDVRDWSLYETIELNERTWMAENLRYRYRPGESSWVYEDNPDNAERFGRLYTWEAAQAACPENWRIPSLKEWQAMLAQFSQLNFSKDEAGAQSEAFEALAADGFSNFSALLGGKRYASGTFGDLGLNGDYWTSTEDEDRPSDAWLFSFNGESRKLESYRFTKDLAISCRCVRE